MNPHWVRLANRLRALRAAAGFSGNSFTKQIGWSQSRVSKLETGKQLPTEADLDAWVKATGASVEQAEDLDSLLAAARVEYATWRAMRRQPGGLRAVQASYVDSEAAAQRIIEYQPAMIPGIVQTAAYSRALLALPGGPPSEDVEGLIAERVRRQAILYQPGKPIQIVLGEAALYNAPGADVMTEQLHRLVDYAGLPSMKLSVIPAGVLPAQAIGFSVEDHGDNIMAYVETFAGEQKITEPAEGSGFLEAFEALRSAAATGSDAVALIRGAMGGAG